MDETGPRLTNATVDTMIDWLRTVESDSLITVDNEKCILWCEQPLKYYSYDVRVCIETLQKYCFYRLGFLDMIW